MHIALWIAQVVLFVAFAGVGAMQLAKPIPELARTMPWVGRASPLFVRVIGAVEVAGAVGLVGPASLRIKPMLTAWSAAGLAIVMALAVAQHVYNGELGVLPLNGVLGALAIFVAWGRSRRAPSSSAA